MNKLIGSRFTEEDKDIILNELNSYFAGEKEDLTFIKMDVDLDGILNEEVFKLKFPKTYKEKVWTNKNGEKCTVYPANRMPSVAVLNLTTGRAQYGFITTDPDTSIKLIEESAPGEDDASIYAPSLVLYDLVGTLSGLKGDDLIKKLISLDSDIHVMEIPFNITNVNIIKNGQDMYNMYEAFFVNVLGTGIYTESVKCAELTSLTEYIKECQNTDEDTAILKSINSISSTLYSLYKYQFENLCESEYVNYYKTGHTTEVISFILSELYSVHLRFLKNINRIYELSMFEDDVIKEAYEKAFRVVYSSKLNMDILPDIEPELLLVLLSTQRLERQFQDDEDRHQIDIKFNDIREEIEEHLLKTINNDEETTELVN